MSVRPQIPLTAHKNGGINADTSISDSRQWVLQDLLGQRHLGQRHRVLIGGLGHEFLAGSHFDDDFAIVIDVYNGGVTST